MKAKGMLVEKWKLHVYGLIALVFLQTIVIILLNGFLKELVEQTDVRRLILYVMLAICVLSDFHFWINRVVLFRRLLSKKSVKCRVEDVFLIGHKDDKRTRYVPYLIVRSMENKKLYFTYDKYSLLNHKAIFNYSGKKDISCTIYKNDKTALQIGDIVDMYMLKEVNILISADRIKNIVKLKDRNFYFHHMNKQVNVGIFDNITCFKGAIDIDVT